MSASDPAERYIGLMSGTSADAIEAVLVQIEAGQCRVEAHHSLPLPDSLHDQILALNQSGEDELDRAGILHGQLGTWFARAVLQLLERSGLPTTAIRAIGSHGQTIRHRPEHGFSVQIGCADRIADMTGIDTIADFRSRDLALGGQGAPLLPRFHQTCLADPLERRVILNLGGMANVTLLNGDELHGGFDTGPANVLLDAWYRRHQGGRFDRDGHWAAGGQLLPDLLSRWLQEPYFQRLPPKSTGRELFDLPWLLERLDGEERPRDVQHTLLHLTARSVAEAVAHFDPARVIVCGGGAYNPALMTQLEHYLPSARVDSVAAHGLAPETVEAAAFAWFAWAFLHRVPANAPRVTGATRPALLGRLHPAFCP